MLNRPLPAPARDIAMLIARIILGVVLFAHGWQKLMINGIADTYGQFEKLGIPAFGSTAGVKASDTAAATVTGACRRRSRSARSRARRRVTRSSTL